MGLWMIVKKEKRKKKREKEAAKSDVVSEFAKCASACAYVWLYKREDVIWIYIIFYDIKDKFKMLRTFVQWLRSGVRTCAFTARHGARPPPPFQMLIFVVIVYLWVYNIDFVICRYKDIVYVDHTNLRIE